MEEQGINQDIFKDTRLEGLTNERKIKNLMCHLDSLERDLNIEIKRRRLLIKLLLCLPKIILNRKLWVGYFDGEMATNIEKTKLIDTECYKKRTIKQILGGDIDP